MNIERDAKEEYNRNTEKEKKKKQKKKCFTAVFQNIPEVQYCIVEVTVT